MPKCFSNPSGARVQERGEERSDAGVVHHHVERAELGDGPVHERVHLRLVGGVRRHDERRATAGTDLVRRPRRARSRSATRARRTPPRGRTRARSRDRCRARRRSPRRPCRRTSLRTPRDLRTVGRADGRYRIPRREAAEARRPVGAATVRARRPDPRAPRGARRVRGGEPPARQRAEQHPAARRGRPRQAVRDDRAADAVGARGPRARRAGVGVRRPDRDDRPRPGRPGARPRRVRRRGSTAGRGRAVAASASSSRRATRSGSRTSTRRSAASFAPAASRSSGRPTARRGRTPGARIPGGSGTSDGVAMLTDEHAPRHTHDGEPMRRMLRGGAAGPRVRGPRVRGCGDRAGRRDGLDRGRQRPGAARGPGRRAGPRR